MKRFLSNILSAITMEGAMGYWQKEYTWKEIAVELGTLIMATLISIYLTR